MKHPLFVRMSVRWKKRVFWLYFTPWHFGKIEGFQKRCGQVTYRVMILLLNVWDDSLHHEYNGHLFKVS